MNRNDSQLTRRHLLQSMMVALAALAVSPLPGILAAPPREINEEETEEETPERTEGTAIHMGGFIEQLEMPNTLYLRMGEERVMVRFLAEASFWHGALEKVADLTPFLPGDEVMLAGRWNNEGLFEATSLNSLCRIIRGQVLSERGNRLETPEGVVYRSAKTVGVDRAEFARLGQGARKALPEKLSGIEIVVEAWRDPATNQFMARQIGA
ncbi:MAG: hypothetical protein H0T73_02885 [Ardenticatenales bacterium]|nr:hypothetical protein [Ardenticatenales bacterium]